MSNLHHGPEINTIQAGGNFRGKTIQFMQQLNCRTETERKRGRERKGEMGMGKKEGEEKAKDSKLKEAEKNTDLAVVHGSYLVSDSNR
jgi:hypothetical protein